VSREKATRYRGWVARRLCPSWDDEIRRKKESRRKKKRASEDAHDKARRPAFAIWVGIS
jgi:hypothetical protein